MSSFQRNLLLSQCKREARIAAAKHCATGISLTFGRAQNVFVEEVVC